MGNMHRRAFLLGKLVLLVCVVLIGVTLAPEHEHGVASQHCCARCHAGPFPFLEPAVLVAVGPLHSCEQVEVSEAAKAAPAAPHATGSTRAPPALLPQIG
jgi:hypothetical protein